MSFIASRNVPTRLVTVPAQDFWDESQSIMGIYSGGHLLTDYM
jgi:hypothetical protein